MYRSKDQPFTPTKATMLTLLLASMLMLMGGAAVAPALPLINEHFPDNDFAVSLVITLPSLAVGLTGFVIGGIADRYGKVRTFIASLVLFTFFGVISFFLDDLYLILVMRFMVGVGIGGITMAVTALMAEYYTGASRVTALSLQSAAMGVGALVLETTGGVMADIGWNYPFLVYLIGVPIIILALFSVKEPAHADPSAMEGRSDFVPDRKLIHIAYATIFICEMAFFIVPTKLPSFVEDPELAGHVTAFAAGLLLGANGVVNTIVAVFYRRLSSVIRPFALIGLGFLVMAIGMVALYAVPNVPMAYASAVLIGCALGMITPAVTNILATQSTASSSGKVMGGYSTFFNFGQFTASLVSVPLLAMLDDSIPGLFGVMGLLVLVCAVLFLGYCSRDRRFRADGSAF